MRIKVLLGIFLVIFLAGCATTRKGQDIQTQQLQNRIDYLEAELERKSQEINNLETELEKVSLRKDKKTETRDSSTLRLSIRQIQTALKNAGFYKGSIDGKIGSQTKEAIKAFQKANNLKPDGIVGKRTAERLSSYLP